VYIKIGRLQYWMRNYDLAMRAYSRVVDLDPQHARAHTRLGMVYAVTEDFDRAIDEFKLAQDLSGADPYLDCFLGYAHAKSGKRAVAKRAIEQLARRSRLEYVPAFCTALVYIGLGEVDQALLWLERAYKDRSVYMVFAKVEPLLDEIRKQSRFVRLMAEMHLS